MTDEPPNTVLLKLDEMRREQEALAAKVGTVATSLVSLMKRLDDIDGSLTVFNSRQHDLKNTTHLVANAADEHTHQLAEIKTRLERIEKKLDLTHA
jgi:tetrahydromethanopterin S-methyltransferase subunit G